MIVLAKRKGRWVLRTTVEAHSSYGRSPGANAREALIRLRLLHLDILIKGFGWKRRR